MAEKKLKVNNKQQKQVQSQTPSSNVLKKAVTVSSVPVVSVKTIKNVAKFDKLESLNFGRVLSIKDGIVIANA